MSYEHSGQYYSELSQVNNDWAAENMILDALSDGYFGSAVASDNPSYLQAYRQGEERRLAEVHQQTADIAQRLEQSRQKLDALGATTANVRVELNSVGRKVEAGIGGSVATLTRLDSLGVKLAALKADVLALPIDEGEF